MSRVHFAFALLAISTIFYLQGPVIDTLGWAYSSDAVSTFTKIHPAIYLYFIAAGLAILDSVTPRVRIDPLIKSWQFRFYVAAVLFLIFKAMRIAASGDSAGEQTLALTTYATPILVLLSTVRLRLNQLSVAATVIRIFFVANSVMALTEVVIHRRFIIAYVEQSGLQGRATALSGTSLNGALLTGLIILLLTFGPRRKFPKIWRLPELALHGLAMFAFGGRAALVALVMALVWGGLTVRSKSGEDRLGVFQRLIPFFVLILGVILILFPPAFVAHTLDRFNFTTDASAATRLVLLDIFRDLGPRQLLWGASQTYLQHLYFLYRTPWGIEAAWLQLIAVFGLVVTLPLLVSLICLLLRLSARLDRSAKLVMLYFFVVTATSLSIGSTSLLISQLILMLMTIGEGLGPITQPTRQRVSGNFSHERLPRMASI